jgi:hypothetical protein
VLNIDMVRITQMVVRVGDEGKNKSDAAFGEPAQLP